MSRSPWSDPDYRRDGLIIVALLAFGVILVGILGLAGAWLLEFLGLWEPRPA